MIGLLGHVHFILFTQMDKTDVGASLHTRNTPTRQHIQRAFKEGRGAIPLDLKLQIVSECN
jgi:hypothetical protein